jgi:hypothetical protein
VWENLGASTFEAGAAKGFKKITTAQRQYAIAGTLHLDHLAELPDSPIHKEPLRRSALQLARSQSLSFEETEKRLNRLLVQHRNEWRDFIRSLGKQSFVANWVGFSA